MHRLLLVAVVVWMSGFIGQGAVIFSDSFDYPDGPVTAAPGTQWTAHSGSGAGDEMLVVAGRLQADASRAEDVNAPLAGQPYTVAGGGMLYARLSVRLTSLPTAAGTYFVHFKDNGTGFRARIWASTSGAAPGKYRLGIGNAAAASASSGQWSADLDLNLTYTIVARYEITTGLSTIWLSPTDESDPSVTASDSTSGITITSFAFRQNSGSGIALVDDVRVATSFAEVMTNTPVVIPPSITAQPQSLAVVQGEDASFSVTASGTEPLHYQWRFNSNPIGGATSSSLTVSNAQPANAGNYSVTVSNVAGAVLSSAAALAVNVPPSIVAAPSSQTVPAGATVVFNVSVAGTSPFTYQWYFDGLPLPDATEPSLTLNNAVPEYSGDYWVVVSNVAGEATSPAAALVVHVVPPAETGLLSLVTYNVAGNFATNWAGQMEAFGRQLQHLNPDIVTFNEIPISQTHEMTNFVATYLPGYNLATNSGADTAIRSVIASRFPINRSQSWLDGVSLTNFGFDGTFTRDLFEAEIQVPDATEPIHIFTTHLKSASDTASATRRAAEASAISNFLVTTFLPTNGTRPYVLTGDLNEDIARPPSTSQQPIGRLVNPATGLILTTPLNPVTGEELTHSIRSPTGLKNRYDYILPGGILYSNIATNFVFRTDALDPLPPGILSDDSATASDHLPVVTVFRYPDPPLVTALILNGPEITLSWPALAAREFRVEVSSDVTTWTVAASNLTSTTGYIFWSTNDAGPRHFFRVVRSP